MRSNYNKRQKRGLPVYEPHRLVTARNWLATRSSASHHDLLNYQARIRELEDDVYELMQSNEQVEGENRELMSGVEEIEFVLQEQETHISGMKASIVKSAKAGSDLRSYEERVSTLGAELRELQSCALRHKEQYEALQMERREEEARRTGYYSKIEETGRLEHRLIREAHSLVHGQEMGEQASMELWQSAEAVIGFSRQVEKKIEERQGQLQAVSKELNLSVIREKERHIALDYKLQLLRARERDREKQKTLLNEGFSFDMLQKEINDLVAKKEHYQHQIHERTQYSKREKAGFEDRVKRLQLQIEQQRDQRRHVILNLQSELECFRREEEEWRIKHEVVNGRLSRYYQEGVDLNDYAETEDQDLLAQIRRIEVENEGLEKEYQRAADQFMAVQAGRV